MFELLPLREAGFDRLWSVAVWLPFIKYLMVGAVVLTDSFHPHLARGFSTACDAEALRTYEIQGRGESSAWHGSAVSLVAIVTADYRSRADGFFVEDAVGDEDPTTSDGLFVRVEPSAALASSMPALTAGLHVRVEGIVRELDGETQLSAEAVVSCGDGLLKPPSNLTLPVDEAIAVEPGRLFAKLEQLEGMRVQVQQELTVAGVHNLERYGELELALAPVPLTYTQTARPNPGDYVRYEQALARRSLVLDDGTLELYPLTPPHFSNAAVPGGVRVGDVIDGLQGVVRHARSSHSSPPGYVVLPLQPPHVKEALRAGAPASSTESVRVVGVNLNNLFKDGGDAAACYPSFTAADCRGADSATDRDDHRARVVAALSAIRPDIVMVSEVQNDFGQERATWQQTVNWLNDAQASSADAACKRYEAVLPDAYFGGDATAVALAFCADRFELAQAFHLAERVQWPSKEQLSQFGQAAVDAYWGPSANRLPLLARFVERRSGKRLTVVANHLKSKSPGRLEHGSCAAAALPDCDKLDGQGYWNQRREDAVTALGAWLRIVHPEQTPLLLVGDFNAYAWEDPLMKLEEQGFSRLTRALPRAAFTYVYNARAGVLDHAFVNSEALHVVQRVYVWQVNAGVIADSAQRFSDHDPLVVDLDLSVREPCDCGSVGAIVGTVGDDVLVGTKGNDVICGLGGNDVLLGLGGRDCVSGGLGDDWLWLGHDESDVSGGPGRDTAVISGWARHGRCDLGAVERCIEVPMPYAEDGGAGRIELARACGIP